MGISNPKIIQWSRHPHGIAVLQAAVYQLLRHRSATIATQAYHLLVCDSNRGKPAVDSLARELTGRLAGRRFAGAEIATATPKGRPTQ
jgi:hypothetical protein